MQEARRSALLERLHKLGGVPTDRAEFMLESMAAFLEIREMEITDETCIIVVEIQGQAGTIMIGIVVDAVSEVLNILGENIEATPTFGTKLNIDYILGMAKMEGGVKILLDIDRVLNHKEVEMMEEVA